MLGRQIALVEGGRTDLLKATRDQWRAQQQRAKWVTDQGESVNILLN